MGQKSFLLKMLLRAKREQILYVKSGIFLLV